jgi:hypothetical protein
LRLQAGLRYLVKVWSRAVPNFALVPSEVRRGGAKRRGGLFKGAQQPY